MARFLLAWELGYGYDRARALSALGHALAAHGHQIAYAVADPLAMSGAVGPVLQAPLPPLPPSLVFRPPRIGGLADQLAAGGFADVRVLGPLIASWRSLLDLASPDAVVGLASPLLWLAAAKRLPMLAIGDSRAMPPAGASALPRFDQAVPPAVAETQMIAAINAVLAASDIAPIGTLGEFFALFHRAHYGLPAFDPYREARRQASLGPLAALPAWRADQGHSILASLDMRCPGIETICLALANLTDLPVDIRLPGAPPTLARFLAEQPRVAFAETAPDADAIAAARIVIHHGEEDLATMALGSGRPQVTIPWHLDGNLVAEALGRLGCARRIGRHAAIGSMREIVAGAARDTVLAQAASHWARELNNAGFNPASAAIVAEAQSLVAASA